MIAENGQGKVGLYDYLELCCQQISKTYGKPERAAWTNGDYVRLSYILSRKTSVQISPNTLKRIFGKIKTDSRYYPQKATRDALASYVGFSDWEQFVVAQQEPFAESPVVSPGRQLVAPVSIDLSQRANAGKGWRWWIGAAAVILVAAVALILQRPTPEQAVPGQLQLVCKNPLGENPHSTNFQIEGPFVGNLSAYSIDFGDEKRKVIDSTTRHYNHYYEKPGRYLAILKQGTRNLDSAMVYLPTKGWAATAYMMYDTTRVYPIESPDLFTGGKRSISALEMAQAGIDTNRTFFIEFVNAQATSIDGDNFELTTHLTTSPTRTGVRCSQVGITVYGESSRHSFDVMKPGCVYWSHVRLSEQFKSGQQDDLGFLGADLRAGGTLKLRVVNQRAHLFINGRKVYEASYTHPLKRVFGINVKFSGIGTINSLSMKDLKSGKLFDGSF